MSSVTSTEVGDAALARSLDGEPIRSIHVGFGEIGRLILGVAQERAGLEPCAVIDPSEAARRVAADAGVPAYENLAQALEDGVDADAAFHATGSRLEVVAVELTRLVDGGFDVVSTCEELSFPLHRSELAAELNRHAEAAGRRILGIGVNPGFVMDVLPLTLTSVCHSLRSIRVSRHVDTGLRRAALREKTGAGISVEEFARRAAQPGSIGHVGLVESLLLLAHGLDWDLEDVASSTDPYVFDGSDEAAGVVHRASGHTTDGRSLELLLEMAVGHPDPGDRIEVEAEPNVSVSVDGGIFGDTATAAVVVNAVAGLRTCAPGLRVASDLIRLHA